MRRPDQLVHSRARLRRRYALFPLEGFPPSVLPSWKNTEARVLTSPAMGAEFLLHHLTIASGGGTRRAPDQRIESFIFLLDGRAALVTDRETPLDAGGFAFLPHQLGFELRSDERTTALLLQKVYEPSEGIEPGGFVIGNERDIPAEVWMNNPASRLQCLIPDRINYDLAMNIFTFDPGHGLPYVETHVMEHGLLMLQGKGMYYLDGEWMEVKKDDFIWIGPYCPQSYYATGPTPTRYIYYKNVNREIPL